ncbi:MAG TPA: hypothetical protein PLN30_00380 [Ferruginibacter sp.]|nr:hypothetical protein [Ferruginibacter sp.]
MKKSSATDFKTICLGIISSALFEGLIAIPGLLYKKLNAMPAFVISFTIQTLIFCAAAFAIVRLYQYLKGIEQSIQDEKESIQAEKQRSISSNDELWRHFEEKYRSLTAEINELKSQLKKN